MSCDCLTLKFCCKRSCDCKNPYFSIPMWIISITAIVIVSYFTVIGYGCLWSQFVWNNVFGHNTSCTPFDPGYFFFIYVFTGLGALLTTAIALGLVIGVVVGIVCGIYGLYFLISGCCGCCSRNYELAREDAKAAKATEKAPLLQVNVDTK